MMKKHAQITDRIIIVFSFIFIWVWDWIQLILHILIDNHVIFIGYDIMDTYLSSIHIQTYSIA